MVALREVRCLARARVAGQADRPGLPHDLDPHGQLRRARAALVAALHQASLAGEERRDAVVVPDLVRLADGGLEPQPHDHDPREAGLARLAAIALATRQPSCRCSASRRRVQPLTELLADRHAADPLDALHPRGENGGVSSR